MYIQKKKVAKILAGLTLLGILASVFAFGVFADEYVIPDTAISSTLVYATRYYKINGLTDWINDWLVTDVPANTRVNWNITHRSSDSSSPICEYGYTYYLTMYINSTQYSNYDGFNFYLTDHNIYSSSDYSISIRALDDFYIHITYANPIQIQLIFRSGHESHPYERCSRFVTTFIALGNDKYTCSSVNTKIYRDMEGTVFNALVSENLEEINGKIDTVNNNLQTIDSSIDDMNTNVGNKLQQVQNKIDAQSQQQHQDAEDIKEDIEDLPQNISDYEKNEIQDEWEAIDNEFSGGGGTFGEWTEDFEAAQIRENLSSLWNAISNTNKNYQITFPASGTVPILDRQLWTEQTVDLQPFASSTVGIILIVACNGVFGIIAVLGIVKWFRTFVVDLLDIDHDPDN